MHANEGDELREQLFRDGYLVLERFWTKTDLDVLQLEAETTLEAAGAYEDDSSGQGGREAGAMRRRGCVFEVLRPFPGQPCPAGALPAGVAAGGMVPHAGSMTGPGPGPGPGPSPSAVQLPSLGLLASPRLHALLRCVLGAPPAAARAACAAACSGQRPDRGAEQAGTAGPSEGSAAGPCDCGDGGSGGSTVRGGCGASGADAGAAQGASASEGSSGRGAGGGPFLFNEQFIVKPPRSSAACAFAMHRDSDWCRGRPEFRYSRYVSAWTAVDDMTAENGALLVVPGSHLEPQDSAWRGAAPAAVAGSCRAPEGAEHPASAERQAELGEMQLQEAQCGVGAKRRRVDEAARCCAGVEARGGGEQEDRLGEAGAGTAGGRGGGGGGAATAPVSGAGGDATLGGGAAGARGAGMAAGGGGGAEAPPRRAVHLLVPAGTMVLFADTLLHGSGPNRSRHMRRAWMPQFSCQPITRRGGSESGACGGSAAPVALAVPLAALAGGGKAQRP
ncbi:hypothetical protein HYH03_015009 [Edaphochlamys debaryana]|uniref:Phytanoyl-CoA dioxygenase n=1 Tax=Edaphochlamys debaryana TaxID=47281 RepID=A0A835XSW8_9CHLO|nr:hypothetical protein HYH03_015009 [Edaphochlamys debaryana]|eukprot:KAG2486305.1 hypothetical protein HYH03_015009 [Edaphochlamys debaryana]